MPWVETDSLSFSARHELEDADAAAATLDRLEEYRSELDALFGTTPGDVAVVMHAHPAALALAHPWLPLARALAAPAGRRYMAGWFAQDEIHVLSPAVLATRASRVAGSREALMLSPLHEYTHLVLAANNRLLPPPFSVRSFSRYVRWRGSPRAPPCTSRARDATCARRSLGACARAAGRPFPRGPGTPPSWAEPCSRYWRAGPDSGPASSS